MIVTPHISYDDEQRQLSLAAAPCSQFFSEVFNVSFYRAAELKSAGQSQYSLTCIEVNHENG
jgi:hypothetical protein